MRVAPGEAARFCDTPPAALTAILLHGDDSGLIAARRKALLAALLGPNAEEELRLTTLPAASLRSDTGALESALRAQSFFGGRQGVVVSDATDGLTAALKAGIAIAAQTGAALLVQAGALAGAAKLRKLFEAHESAAALLCRAAPPGRAALERMLAAAGVASAPDALDALLHAAATLDHQSVAALVERVALYKLGDPTPLTAQEVAPLAGTGEAGGLDPMLDALFDRNPTALRAALSRLAAQGVSPHAAAIAAARRARLLHAAAASPAGPEPVLARARPPLFGPRRDAAARQAQRWGARRLETAIADLHALNDALRATGGPAPETTLERALLGLSMRRIEG